MNLFVYTFSLLCLTSLRLALGQVSQPQVRLITSKPTNCKDNKGLLIEKAQVRSATQASVDVVVYLQRYDGVWTKKFLTGKGGDDININLSDCEYTGNYYAFAVFTSKGIETAPHLNQVKEMHLRKGIQPKFRVIESEPDKNCKEGGYIFYKGYVYTPRGEKVKISFFMEKKDGSWRKKHYEYTGSGVLNMDIWDCELTGKYKAYVTLVK
jgi:hypothetical protein